MPFPPYIVLEKAVGQTPLACVELWRAAQPPAYRSIPLAYAGRLDPLASGKLLVLIGDTCKVQERYHALDKRYEFSILLGVKSDTGDVMGRLTFATVVPTVASNDVKRIAKNFVGTISLPFPVFSARTVKGKPLHTWAMEGRLAEITIPTQQSTVHDLRLTDIKYLTRQQVYDAALSNVNSIPPVTELRKALGNDFRRDDIRSDWRTFVATGSPTDVFTIVHMACIASSGTYMRSLAEAIGATLGFPALAFHIHRTHIGNYQPLPFHQGLWRRRFT